jgi:hypothetical protein
MLSTMDTDTQEQAAIPVVGDTNNGILVGADQPEPTPPAPDLSGQPEESPLPTYTEEDLKRVREQEKSKVYSRLEKMNSELEILRKEREERISAEERESQAAAEAARLQEEQEMDLRSLLEKRDQEWQQRLDEIKAEQERDRALLEQERQYAELTAYQAQRLEEERDNILPELLDLVTGSTPQEIDASIESLKERSDRIFESAQQAMSSARREVAGARVTMPTPVENTSENRQYTPEDIRNMSLQEYAQHRQRLLSNQAQGRSQGLFG